MSGVQTRRGASKRHAAAQVEAEAAEAKQQRAAAAVDFKPVRLVRYDAATGVYVRDATVHELLVPIKLDVDHCKDTLTWNLLEQQVSAEQFARELCMDTDLSASLVPMVARQMNTQLCYFRDLLFEKVPDDYVLVDSPAAGDGAANSVESAAAAAATSDSSVAESTAATDATTAEAAATAQQPPAIKIARDALKEHLLPGANVVAVPFAAPEAYVRRRTLLEMYEARNDALYDEYEAAGGIEAEFVGYGYPFTGVIVLDFAIGNVALEDRFEWDCGDPLYHNARVKHNNATPESFARAYCLDMALPREFEVTIAHNIREQALLHYKRFLGSHFRGGTLAANMVLKLVEPVRPIDLVRVEPVASHYEPELFQTTAKEYSNAVKAKRRRLREVESSLKFPQ